MIRIEGHGEGNGFRLLCRDEGGGDAESIARIMAGGGLGSRIIRTLATSIRGRTDWRAIDRGVQLTLSVTRETT